MGDFGLNPDKIMLKTHLGGRTIYQLSGSFFEKYKTFDTVKWVPELQDTLILASIKHGFFVIE